MKLFMPIVFLALTGALFFGYVNPTYSKIKELRVEESSYNEALTRARELQERRDELLSRFNAFPEADRIRLEKLLPDHIDNVRLILDFDAMASRYGMRVRNVAIESDQGRTTRGQVGPDESSSESVILSFTVSGTYDTFRQFLTDLERSLRLVDVVGLSFTAGDTGVYDFKLKVKTYWLKP